MDVNTTCGKVGLPFIGLIHGGLQDGLMVKICGSIPYLSQRFQINFQCGGGRQQEMDIAFHFNPRFDSYCVVANSFVGGKWQEEVKMSEIPFQKGQAFEIQFLVTLSCFKVTVNGKHYLDFKHRVPLSQVDTIYVAGDFEVFSIYY